MKVGLRWLRLSETLTTLSWVKVAAYEVELSDSDDDDLLPMAGDVFSSDEDFAASRSWKR